MGGGDSGRVPVASCRAHTGSPLFGLCRRANVGVAAVAPTEEPLDAVPRAEGTLTLASRGFEFPPITEIQIIERWAPSTCWGLRYRRLPCEGNRQVSQISAKHGLLT